MSSNDARLQWLKAKACRGLCVEPQMFDEALETSDALDAMNGFLNGGADCTALLISLQQATIQVEELHEVVNEER
jgi:dynein heavy chain